MKASLEKACVPRRVQLAAWGLVLGLPLYVLSIGPVAWATNNVDHPPYLPQEVIAIYLPLAPLLRIECVNEAFTYYCAEVWHGFPYGYTTL